MSWIDLSFKEPASTVTRAAHDLGLTTQIVEKVPAWKLIVMRIGGEEEALELFLIGHFEERAANMHLKAIRNGDTPILGRLKDRKLRENRNATALC